MEPFLIHTGKIAVLPDDNVDTDRIIPARYLTRISRFGYGELLFADVRGEGFALDLEAALGASVLVVGSNFGCGSSREHAVWALQQAGFRAVIARQTGSTPGFSDIFRQNAANCGLLLIELPDELHQRVANLGSGAQVTIDLQASRLRFGGEELPFQINPATRHALLEGLDLIGTTLRDAGDIDAFEASSKLFVPLKEARS